MITRSWLLLIYYPTARSCCCCCYIYLSVEQLQKKKNDKEKVKKYFHSRHTFTFLREPERITSYCFSLRLYGLLPMKMPRVIIFFLSLSLFHIYAHFLSFFFDRFHYLAFVIELFVTKLLDFLIFNGFAVLTQ